MPPTSKRLRCSGVPCKILRTEAEAETRRSSRQPPKTTTRLWRPSGRSPEGFKPVGVGGLDGTVQRPSRRTDQIYSAPFHPSPLTLIIDAANKANRDLRTFCISQKSTLGKYPFQPTSPNDASLEEFDRIFHPGTGAIWKFQQQSLAELIVKEGSLWKPKDPAKKPLVTQDYT